MSQLLPRTNDAIHANGNHFVNGAAADIAITTHGSDWYFVGLSLMELHPMPRMMLICI